MLAKLETDASGAMVPLLCQLYRGRSSWRRWRSPDQLASIKPVSPQERGDHKEASDAADSHCHSGTRAVEALDTATPSVGLCSRAARASAHRWQHRSHRVRTAGQGCLTRKAESTASHDRKHHIEM